MQKLLLCGLITVISTVGCSSSKPNGEGSNSAEDKPIQTGDGVLALEDEASSLAFSRNGRLLAVGHTFGGIQIWDMTSRSKRTGLAANLGTPHALDFSPDGTMLVSGHTRSDSNVLLWDVPNGEIKTKLAGHKAKVYAVAFSANGNVLASAGADLTVRLWKPETGESLQVLNGHKNEIRGLSFSPDGTLLASSSGDFLNNLPGEVIIWNVESGKQVKVINTKQSNDVAFTSDGTLLVATDGDGLTIWRVNTWEQQKKLKPVFGCEFEQISISSDAKFVAACGLSVSSIVWNLNTGELVKELPQMRDVAFAPKGNLLAGADRDSKIQLVDVKDKGN